MRALRQPYTRHLFIPHTLQLCKLGMEIWEKAWEREG